VSSHRGNPMMRSWENEFFVCLGDDFLMMELERLYLLEKEMDEELVPQKDEVLEQRQVDELVLE
jgi:hypothetical protein